MMVLAARCQGSVRHPFMAATTPGRRPRMARLILCFLPTWVPRRSHAHRRPSLQSAAWVTAGRAGPSPALRSLGGAPAHPYGQRRAAMETTAAVVSTSADTTLPGAFHVFSYG